MAVKTMEVAEAKDRLLELVALVAKGTEVILTRENSPVASIVPAKDKGKRTAGLHPHAMKMNDDFDDALPYSFWSTS